MKRLTMEDIANVYDKQKGGRRARTLPMDTVMEWAISRSDLFTTDKEGYFYHAKKEK